MPKMKTKSAAKKRFAVTGSGKSSVNMLTTATFLQRSQTREREYWLRRR